MNILIHEHICEITLEVCVVIDYNQANTCCFEPLLVRRIEMVAIKDNPPGTKPMNQIDGFFDVEATSRQSLEMLDGNIVFRQTSSQPFRHLAGDELDIAPHVLPRLRQCQTPHHVACAG